MEESGSGAPLMANGMPCGVATVMCNQDIILYACLSKNDQYGMFPFSRKQEKGIEEKHEKQVAGENDM